MSWHEIGSLKSYVSQTLPTIGNLGFGSVMCSVLCFCVHSASSVLTFCILASIEKCLLCFSVSVWDIHTCLALSFIFHWCNLYCDFLQVFLVGFSGQISLKSGSNLLKLQV